MLIDACWAISCMTFYTFWATTRFPELTFIETDLSDGSNDKIQAVIEAGIPRRLVELLMHASTSVQTPALRSVGNIGK